MTIEESVRALFESFGADNSIQTIYAVVKSVQGDTCTVEVNGLELDGVRLRMASKGVLLLPKVGSEVLVSMIENDPTELYVCCFGEVEKAGVSNDTTSLKDVIDDLMSLLKTFKVITPQGVSTAVEPTTLANVNALAMKIGNLII